jgi:hypothetical protein
LRWWLPASGASRLRLQRLQWHGLAVARQLQLLHQQAAGVVAAAALASGGGGGCCGGQ